MCTAISYQQKSHYFGRNLDLEREYGETVIITPRNYPFHFRNGTKKLNHYAIIGMGLIAKEYPLYFDATNETGLSMAGLNFPKNAVYFPKNSDMDNISPFELIPWILCQCTNIDQAKKLFENLNIWDEAFSADYPLSPLHWMIADASGCCVLESTNEGLKLYDNPVGVLTNNPNFEYHMLNLSNYLNITSRTPENRFSDQLDLKPYSLGMGTMGLPGDPSSSSRFVRAAFTKCNSVSDDTEDSAVTQFFHILGSVAQQKGVTMLPDGQYEYTMYSSCCNTDKGIYYYTTYKNSRICAVNMHNADLNGQHLQSFPRDSKQDILFLN